MRVLLVEDSELIASGLKVLLESQGYSVDVALTLAAARACLQSAPDCVLLDLTLPDGDGLELLREKLPDGCTRPVVFAMTGHADAVSAQRCMDAGCVHVLVKPVPIQHLLGQLAQLRR